MAEPLFKRKQLIKLGLFLLASGLSFMAVIGNRPEIAILAVCLITGIFWNKAHSPLKEEYGDAVVKEPLSTNRLILSGSLILYAVLTGAGAVYIANSYPVNILSLVCWVVSIILLLAAGIVYDRFNPFSWFQQINKLERVARRNLIIEILVVIVIAGVALLLRATNLEYYPPMVHGDEGIMGLQAMRVLGKGDPLAPFQAGWAGFANLFYYFQSISLAIFGQNLIGLRMTSAVMGTLNVVLLYLIGRKFWGKLAGVAAAWLMTVSHFNIQYSRLGLNNIESVFFMELFLLLFLFPFSEPEMAHHLEKEEPQDKIQPKPNRIISLTLLIGSGIAAGVAQYMYFGSRLIPIVALLIFVFLLLRKKITIFQLSLVALTAFLIFAPLGAYYIQNPEQFFSRMDTVSIFTPGNVTNNYGSGLSLAKNTGDIVLQQLKKNLNFFLQSGDASAFYYQDLPAFDIFTAVLFWLGLGVVASRIKRTPDLAVISWFAMGIVFAGLITNDSPNGPRLLVVTPTVYLIGGIFLQKVWEEVNLFFKRIPNLTISPAWLISPLLSLILIGTLAINLVTYFYTYASAGVNIVAIAIAREIISDAPKDHIYLMGDGFIYTDYEAIRFVAGDGHAADLKKLEDLPPLVNDGKGIIVLGIGSHIDEIKSLEQGYPQGSMSYVNDPLARIIFSRYYIPPINSK